MRRIKPFLGGFARTVSHSHARSGNRVPPVFLQTAMPVQIPNENQIHTTPSTRFLDVRGKDVAEKEKQLMVREDKFFDEAAKIAKDKETYRIAISKYIKRSGLYRRGHVEFMYAALDRMKEFNAHKDIQTYKELLEIFPKEKMVPRSTWEVEMMHYPKQQQCCIDILDFMGEQGVCPDDAMGHQLIGIFGDKAHAFRKYQRMMYWMPKFKHANPYPVPFELPHDGIELAKIALERMAVDLENKLSVNYGNEVEDFLDPTFIVSAQSPHQKALIDTHPIDQPLYVEGGFTVWLREESLVYFVLRGKVTNTFEQNQEREATLDDDENLFSWKPLLSEEQEEKDIIPVPTIHEQEDGTILGMCITGTGSKDSLASWIKHLQKNNPRLGSIPVIFQLRTPDAGIVPVDQETDNSTEIGLST